jgi:uncharacterized protein YjiS (DUF1127 family)
MDYSSIDTTGSRFVQRVFELLRWQPRRRGAIRELTRLSDWQLQDIGIVRGEIPAVVDTLLSSTRAAIHPAGAAARTSTVTVHERTTVAANDGGAAPHRNAA